MLRCDFRHRYERQTSISYFGTTRSALNDTKVVARTSGSNPECESGEDVANNQLTELMYITWTLSRRLTTVRTRATSTKSTSFPQHKMFWSPWFPGSDRLFSLQRKSNLPAGESGLWPSRESGTRIADGIGRLLQRVILEERRETRA